MAVDIQDTEILNFMLADAYSSMETEAKSVEEWETANQKVEKLM
jgi:hypothetical protein